MADVVTPTTEKQEGSPVKCGSPLKKVDPEVMEAYNLLAQGKRNLLCGEVVTAVSQLAESCKRLAKEYGETADQCAEVYYYYGKSLLEMSRMESGVLGNALQGIEEEEEEESDDKSEEKSQGDKVEDPDKLTEEEKEKVSIEVYDAMAEREEEKKAREAKEKSKKENGEATSNEKKENGEATSNGTENGEATSNGTENGEASSKENGVEKPQENGQEATTNGTANGHAEANGKEENGVEKNGKDDSSQEGDEEGPSTADESEDIGDEEGEGEGGEPEEAAGQAESGDPGEGGSGEGKKEDEEDVSNLQLAWEMLELAKVIYSKCEEKELQLKLADTYLTLGEVGLETEQYEQAIADFKKCLEIQKKHEEKESRCIAETLYQIGLACSFTGLYDEAVENLKLAVETIEAKVAKLKAYVEEFEQSEEGKKKNNFDVKVIDAQKDIKDLMDIIPDILAKIEDCKDEKRDQEKVKQMVKENVAAECGTTTTVGFGESSSSSSSSAPAAKPIQARKANDISHMIRKKRKPEEDTEVSEDAKKAKQENGAGDAPTNGEEKMETAAETTTEATATTS